MLNHSYLIDSFWRNSDDTTSQFDFAQLENIVTISAVGYALIIIAISFSIILWLSRKIWAKYHNTKNSMSAKTQAMQKQLTIVLIAQAACPICVTIIPCLFLIAIVLLRINMPGIATPCFMGLAWNAVLNPLCTILLVAPFRKAVKQCFQWKILKARLNRVFVLT
uniref:G-protein coupled receptors family 1 profile domain-containing protein n=1 Tax=Acrobeloides nanus TaxID=290746 RepID=A0A914EQI1_9BILA